MINDKSNLSQHFSELRRRVFFAVIFFVISFFICYFFSEQIYQFLLQPLIEILSSKQNHRIIYTGPAEAFITYLKLSFSSALFFSLPIFLTEIYLFLSPALYKKEKKFILLTFFFSPFLFLLGGIFAYYFILPIAFKFFLTFENQGFTTSSILPIQLEIKISEYLKFVTNLLLGFGIAFQLPILLLFLIKVGSLSVNDLRKKRRFWIVMFFIASAILTPPDLLSQFSLAILMILVFEIVIIIGNKFSNKK